MRVMYTPISVFMQQGQEKRQAVRRRYRYSTELDVRAQPQKRPSALATSQLCILESPKDEQPVTPMINDWLEPQLHVL